MCVGVCVCACVYDFCVTVHTLFNFVFHNFLYLLSCIPYLSIVSSSKSAQHIVGLQELLNDLTRWMYVCVGNRVEMAVLGREVVFEHTHTPQNKNSTRTHIYKVILSFSLA